MAFEHKSLKANFAQFRGSLDRINQVLMRGNEVAPKAETNLNGLVDQIEAVVEDVEAMATLGNGSGDSGEGQEKPKPAPVTDQPPSPPANPAPPQGQQDAVRQAVGQGTFQQS